MADPATNVNNEKDTEEVAEEEKKDEDQIKTKTMKMNSTNTQHHVKYQKALRRNKDED